MIYVIHNINKVVKLLDSGFNKLTFNIEESIPKVLFNLAKSFPEELIIWCNEAYFNNINHIEITNIFHHKRIFTSYSVNKNRFIPDQIGYVDQSVFINVNRHVCYPTWLMSSDIGGLHSELLNSIPNNIKIAGDFNYFLNSFAKTSMSQGVFCYSNPLLLKKEELSVIKTNQASNYQLFRFVSEHYKDFWVFMLFFCSLWFEKKMLFLPYLRAFFYKRVNYKLNDVIIKSTKKDIVTNEVDVIIPTIGRKKYLLDVLKDLSNQTLIPKNIIIIEQNPLPNSESQLEYLHSETWPFNIKHEFTHQTGACNARNIALKKLESDWCFFADDDIRFENNLIEEALAKVDILGIDAINMSCLLKEQKQTHKHTHQTDIFGSGSSMVKSKFLKDITFNLAYEFGYGEDSDFGMQLRNTGVDVVYVPSIKLVHLKAPIGGFRTKVKQLWDDDVIQPKPLPTMMLFLKNYTTAFQIKSYKCILFFKFYKNQKLKNPFLYIKQMKKQWQQSYYWSEKLIKEKDA